MVYFMRHYGENACGCVFVRERKRERQCVRPSERERFLLQCCTLPPCNKQPETFLHTKVLDTLSRVSSLSLSLSLSLSVTYIIPTHSLPLSAVQECKSTTTMIRSGEVKARIVVMVFVYKKLFFGPSITSLFVCLHDSRKKNWESLVKTFSRRQVIVTLLSTAAATTTTTTLTLLN